MDRLGGNTSNIGHALLNRRINLLKPHSTLVPFRFVRLELVDGNDLGRDLDQVGDNAPTRHNTHLALTEFVKQVLVE